MTQSLKLKVIGISFHIGSSCEDYDSYLGALRVSRKIFNDATKLGFHFRILDIGGGFPGENFEKINEFSGLINNVLDEEFPEKEFPDLQIYSEPGRYFVESAFTLVSKIHSRKITKDSDGEIIDVMYYLNEGVYSNFLFVPLGPEVVIPKLLPAKQSEIKFKSTLWGKFKIHGNLNQKINILFHFIICNHQDQPVTLLTRFVWTFNWKSWKLMIASIFNQWELTQSL